MNEGQLKSWLSHSKPLEETRRVMESIKKQYGAAVSPKRKGLLEGPALVSSFIDEFLKSATEDKIATNVEKALSSGCEGHDVYNVISKSEAKGINAQLKPGAVLMRADLEALINCVVGHAGGVIDLDDRCVATAKVEDSNTTNKRGVVIPKMAQELARVLKRKVAARVELDQLRTTPQRIVDALCPELEGGLKEVTRLIRRIYDRTGSSARIKELEDADEPVAYQGTTSALQGDPNNIGGVQKCPNCEKR